ncbi:MAG: GFA family protein [Hyphomonas sp.]
MPSLPLDGGCHCGAIRYQLTRAPFLVYNCHCMNCQKISASVFGTALTIPAGGIAVICGNSRRFEWESDVGSRRFGEFCGDCGTRLWHGMIPDGKTLSLRAGTLDETGWLQPVADFWTDSAQSWVTFAENRLRYSKQPQSTDYPIMMEAFRALGQFD